MPNLAAHERSVALREWDPMDEALAGSIRIRDHTENLPKPNNRVMSSDTLPTPWTVISGRKHDASVNRSVQTRARTKCQPVRSPGRTAYPYRGTSYGRANRSWT